MKVTWKIMASTTTTFVIALWSKASYSSNSKKNIWVSHIKSEICKYKKVESLLL